MRGENSPGRFLTSFLYHRRLQQVARQTHRLGFVYMLNVMFDPFWHDTLNHQNHRLSCVLSILYLCVGVQPLTNHCESCFYSKKVIEGPTKKTDKKPPCLGCCVGRGLLQLSNEAIYFQPHPNFSNDPVKQVEKLSFCCENCG